MTYNVFSGTLNPTQSINQGKPARQTPRSNTRSNRRCNGAQCNCNKAIVDITLRPRCALPSPPSRTIGRIACAQNFPDSYLRLPGTLNDPFCCMTLLAIGSSLLQRTRYNALSMGRKTPEIAPCPCDFVTLLEPD